MAKLDIIYYDDPLLRRIAQPIGQITERHRQLADDMAETMYGARGIGLAANQVGLTERIIVVDVEWADKDGKKGTPLQPIAMINPEILEEGAEDEVHSEGCLSLPDIEGDVWRPAWIRMRYQNLQGAWIEREATGMLARCVQHEVDHLNGKLFIDRMKPEDRVKLAGKLARLRQSRAKQPA